MGYRSLFRTLSALMLGMMTLLVLTQTYRNRYTLRTDTRRGVHHKPTIKDLSQEYEGLLYKYNISYTNEFYIITMLSLYCGHIWPGYEKYTVEQLNERDSEYLATLESNLNHPLVKEVHLLYTDEEPMNVVRKQRWKHMDKLIPVKSNRRVHMMDFFYYASHYLLDKTVIAMNGDITLGEGFDQIDSIRMRDERVLYSLTRHGYKSAHNSCEVQNYCLDRKYQGSHDTHVFRLAEPLNEELMLRLDYPINMWQAENGMLGAFKYLFNFSIRNPCKVLKTYHRHCSPVHKQGKTYSILNPPYNWKRTELGRAEPIDQLLYGN